MKEVHASIAFGVLLCLVVVALCAIYSVPNTLVPKDALTIGRKMMTGVVVAGSTTFGILLIVVLKRLYILMDLEFNQVPAAATPQL